MLAKQSNISNYFSNKYEICVGACTGKIETLDSSTVPWEMKLLFIMCSLTADRERIKNSFVLYKNEIWHLIPVLI